MPSLKNKPLGVLSAIAGLVSLSAVAGVLITAMVTPALAVTSMTTNASIGVFESLPDYMEIGELAQKNVLWAKKGGEYVQFAEIYKHNREEVSWEQVSPFIKDAVVAGEDRRYYDHGGVDVQGIVRAAIANFTSDDIASGASTLAQQLVKNINIQEALLLPDKKERDKAIAEAQAQTIDRKLREAKFAIGLEKKYTKNQIMLAYLNITGFGGNTYGIQSAAKEYYGTTVDKVSLVQAASLLAIVQSPNRRNLDDPKKYPANEKRRDYILDSMLDLNMITQAQHNEAVNTPVEDYVDYHEPTSGCSYASDAKLFCDYVLKSVKDLPMLGATPEDRQANWDRGGYNVYTTLDLRQQDNAQKIVRQYAPPSETRLNLGGVAVSTQVGTGRVLIMAQNKIFNDTGEGDKLTTTAVDLATDRGYGGSSGFPTGSTYKIFTLTDWLKNGHGLGDIVNGNQRVFTSFPAKCDGGAWVGRYRPSNDNHRNAGPVNVLRATSSSINVAFMSMAHQLDLCEIRDTATSMGVHRADGAPLTTVPSAILGTNEIAPLTMALAVATVSGGGIYCAAKIVDRIVGPDGTDLGGQPENCHRAFTPDVAAGVARAMYGVVHGGTGSMSNPRNGVPIIGKTGTTDDSFHTWMVGSSTKNALAVWVGNISGQVAMRSVRLAGVSGVISRHAIFKPIITALTNTFGGGAFPTPSASIMRGHNIAVPSVFGMSVEDATTRLESLGFRVTVDDAPIASSATIGAVAGTSPANGTRVSKGYEVTIHTSDGSLYLKVPSDLVGKSPSDAKSELVSVGFSAGKITYKWVEVTDPPTYCTVTGSNPSGGSGAAKDSAVTLKVGSNADGTPPPGCSP